MSNRYVLFVTEEQVKKLAELVENRLGVAMKMGYKEEMILLSGLVYQLRNPRPIREKYEGWFTLFRKQLLGR